MPLFRRKQADPAIENILASFRTCAARVDAAQRALLSAIPTARHPGLPLDEAIQEFRRLLSEAASAMLGWQEDSVLHEWTSCVQGLEEASALALNLLPGTGFEALTARVGDALHPLEAFAEAAAALRRL